MPPQPAPVAVVAPVVMIPPTHEQVMHNMMPGADKSWSAIMAREQVPTFLAHQSPQFQQEFPKLASEGVAGATGKPGDAQYGPGPSLRPQSMKLSFRSRNDANLASLISCLQRREAGQAAEDVRRPVDPWGQHRSHWARATMDQRGQSQVAFGPTWAPTLLWVRVWARQAPEECPFPLARVIGLSRTIS